MTHHAFNFISQNIVPFTSSDSVETKNFFPYILDSLCVCILRIRESIKTSMKNKWKVCSRMQRIHGKNLSVHEEYD